jgi:UDP-N-acetylmuramoyl-tripeptide--D-alanyl-D-alanine ligase
LKTAIEIYELFSKHPKITIDSRKDVSDSLFFGIKGENFNGNIYAKAAIEKGAACAIVDDDQYAVDQQIILVENSLECLQHLAEIHRKKLHIPLIAITGSNGKTTTKELVYRVLAQRFNVFATPEISITTSVFL